MARRFTATFALIGILILMAGCNDSGSGSGTEGGGDIPDISDGDLESGGGDGNPVPDIDTSQLADQQARDAYENYRTFAAEQCMVNEGDEPVAGCWISQCGYSESSLEGAPDSYSRVMFAFESTGKLKRIITQYTGEGCPMESLIISTRLSALDRDYTVGEAVSSSSDGTVYPMDLVISLYGDSPLANTEYTIVRVGPEGQEMCLPAAADSDSRVEYGVGLPTVSEEGQRPTTIDAGHCLQRP